jgi:hypothetical protein
MGRARREYGQSLGEQFTVNSLKLLTNCPKFKNLKLLPYRVQSAVSEEAFQVFVSALGGSDLAITTENMNDLVLLCEEFGFAALRSKILAFQELASVIDHEVRRRVGGVEEQNMEQDRNLELLQKEVPELWTSCSPGESRRGGCRIRGSEQGANPGNR